MQTTYSCWSEIVLLCNKIKPLGGNADVVIGLMINFMGERDFTEAGTVRDGKYAMTIISGHAADIPCLSRIDTLPLRFVVCCCC